MHRPLFLILALQLVQAHAAPVDFARDIEPLLAEHCLDCHGPEKSKSSLRVDRRASLLRGGEHLVPALVPGKPHESFLLEVIRGDDLELRMPPKGNPLTKTQIDLLSRWIKSGAPWPGQMDEDPNEITTDHWSFQAWNEETGEENSIDGFIRKKLTAQGLSMNPPAAPHTLIRRLHYTLTGLPPSPQQVETFVSSFNQHPASSIQHLADELLASPHYGERWAQHWLDIIRWAETVGFETNRERPNAWPYRDWVIESLNADKPYDRFLFEQIAGDTVGEDAALGFLVAGPANLAGQIGRDEAAMRGARQDELDEVIRTVGQAALGLTIGCARCHDHKFDPILQRDYFSLQAVFAGLTYGDRRLRGPENDAMTARVAAARATASDARNQLEALRVKHGLHKPLADIQTESFEPVHAAAIRMRIAATANGTAASLYEFETWSTDDINVALASNGATPSASSFALANQSRHFDNLIDGTVDKRQAFPWVAEESGPAWFRIDFKGPATVDRVVWHRGGTTPSDHVIEILPPGSDQWREVAHTRDRLPRIDDIRKPDTVRLASLPPEEVKAIVDQIGAIRRAEGALSRLSKGPQVYAAGFTAEPDPTFLLRRGDPMQRRAEVPPAIPAVLGNLELPLDTPETERRLALARHLTRPDHPLTARVIVNRVWHHHFGTGLVETPSDFGKMGAAPSHPELLDFLAKKFVEGGWSLKKLHRLILASQTYQQASTPRSEALAIDADSRLLWRFPPRRLEAEAIRDSILSVSGKLNLETGGPGFDFFNQRGGLSDYKAKETFDEKGWRRMIYAHKVRMISVDIFGSFDCPDAGQMKPSRTRSITPVQSLGLLNSPFVGRQAEFFAERLRTESGDNPGARIDRAFALTYSRPPTAKEKSKLTALARDHGLEQVCRALFNTSEFAFIQ